MHTLIVLHDGRKMKSEAFTSCRGRVNISGGSEIARIDIECNAVAILLKVKKHWQACATPVIPP